MFRLPFRLDSLGCRLRRSDHLRIQCNCGKCRSVDCNQFTNSTEKFNETQYIQTTSLHPRKIDFSIDVGFW
jgi:hypothetical protein